MHPLIMPRALRVVLSTLGVTMLVLVLVWLVSSDARALVLLILGCISLVTSSVACLLKLPAWLVARDTTVSALGAEQLASAINAVRTTLVQGLVGLVALGGIAVAWQQL